MRTNQEQEGWVMSFGDAPDDFEFSLQFVLGRVPVPRFRAAWRALGEGDQHVVARAIRENLELSGWRYRRGASSNARPQDTHDGDDPFADAIDEVIETCDGDPRATIKALLIANAYLEAELRTHEVAPVTRGAMMRNVKAK
jgi:hypothetical protein